MVAMVEERRRVNEPHPVPRPQAAANSGSYGIYSEFNAREPRKGERTRVVVHSRKDEPFSDRVPSPEDPGRYCFPPFANCITGAAQLMPGHAGALRHRHGWGLGVLRYRLNGHRVHAAWWAGTVPQGNGGHAGWPQCGTGAFNAQVEATRDRFSALVLRQGGCPSDLEARSGGALPGHLGQALRPLRP